MAKIPQCWRDCKNEHYREKIDRERKLLLKQLDEGVEKLQKIRRLIYGGALEEIYSTFQDCQKILGNSLGRFHGILSIHCDKCEHRNFDIDEIKP